MSEPEPAGWEPSFSEALWRDAGSAGRERRLPEAGDRLSDHMDALWGDPRPDPDPAVVSRLLEAVWGSKPAPGSGQAAASHGPEQLSLFDIPAAGADPDAPGPT